MKKQWIIFTGIYLGTGLFFSGCATLDDVLLEEMEGKPKVASIAEEDEAISLRSINIVCVDAYVQVGSVIEYKGTTCWIGGGSRPAGVPSEGSSGPTYAPNGYPTSQGGTGFNTSQQNVWQFPFRGLQNSLLYGFSSTLNLMEKEHLMNVFALFDSSGTSEDFKAISNYLISKGIRINFKMDNTIAHPAQYSIVTKEITFRDVSLINLDNLIEELIHAVQDQGFYGTTMSNMSKNCEFEAKVFRDLAANFRSEDYGDCLGTNVGSMDESTNFMNEYSLFIDQIISNRRFTDISKFNDLCNRWTSYSGSYTGNFTPRVLQHFFGKIKPPKN